MLEFRCVLQRQFVMLTLYLHVKNGHRYVHIDRGAPKFMEIFVTQMPRSTGSILLSTRYPQGTNFVIKRLFNWYPQLNAQLWQADSLAALQQSDGQAYHFDGRWLTLKVTDPGSPNLTPLKWKGITIEHSRYYDLRYEVTDSRAGSIGGLEPRMQANLII